MNIKSDSLIYEEEKVPYETKHRHMLTEHNLLADEVHTKEPDVSINIITECKISI